MNKVQETLIQGIATSLKNLYNIVADEKMIMIETPKDSSNGDYSTNIAMRLTKQLGKRPQEIAGEIKEELQKVLDNVDKIEIAGVGFINFWLKKDALADIIKVVLDKKDDYGKGDMKSSKCLVEYVSANPTGNLHVGHARGAAWGDALTRILKFAGYEVLREYYINDAGNQIHNLGLSLQARYFQICGLPYLLPEDGYHGQDVIDIAKKLYEENGDSLKSESVQFFADYGKKQELENIKQDLNGFRVGFDSWLSELSLYERDLVDKVVKDLTKKGYTYEDEGAIWFKSTQFGDDKDRVLKKSDGSYTYLTPDIANHINKYERGYDHLINLWGADHHGYIARMKNALQAFGYAPENLDVDIIQMVRIVKHTENGVEEVKMSKRTGNAITLKELYEEVGVDAARYFFVSKALDTQMDFDMDLAVSQSNDNPVYYAQYAYARMCSILKQSPKLNALDHYDLLVTEKETELLKNIASFANVVEDTANSRNVNKICNYIQKLATSFHSFYGLCKVNDPSNPELSNQRIALLEATRITLKNALDLIGVNAPEKM